MRDKERKRRQTKPMQKPELTLVFQFSLQRKILGEDCISIQETSLKNGNYDFALVMVMAPSGVQFGV